MIIEIETSDDAYVFTLEEARDIYEQLKELFGDVVKVVPYVQPYVIPETPWGNPLIWCETTALGWDPDTPVSSNTARYDPDGLFSYTK